MAGDIKKNRSFPLNRVADILCMRADALRQRVKDGIGPEVFISNGRCTVKEAALASWIETNVTEQVSESRRELIRRFREIGIERGALWCRDVLKGRRLLDLSDDSIRYIMAGA